MAGEEREKGRGRWLEVVEKRKSVREEVQGRLDSKER